MPVPSLVELRRYRMRPGGRDALIDLFDRELVESQEACGMRILGQFRDLDDADAFVWMRAFDDLKARTAALAGFYGGPVWAEHRPAAVATMLNSENALLLEPLAPDEGFGARTGPRPPAGETAAAPGLYLAATCSLAPGAAAGFAAAFASARGAIERAGARIEATMIRKEAANGFPRLPLREGETLFIWIASFPDEPARRAWQAALAADADWTGRLWPDLDRRMWRRMEVARLRPTTRSAMRR